MTDRLAYSVKEVAEALGVSEWKVREEIYRKRTDAGTAPHTNLHVAAAPRVGPSAGWARGARRSTAGEPGHNPGLRRRQVGHRSRRSGRSQRMHGCMGPHLQV